MKRAEALFDEIEGRYAAGLTDFRADTSVYNALINCEWGFVVPSIYISWPSFIAQ